MVMLERVDCSLNILHHNVIPNFKETLCKERSVLRFSSESVLYFNASTYVGLYIQPQLVGSLPCSPKMLYITLQLLSRKLKVGRYSLWSAFITLDDTPCEVCAKCLIKNLAQFGDKHGIWFVCTTRQRSRRREIDSPLYTHHEREFEGGTDWEPLLN